MASSPGSYIGGVDIVITSHGRWELLRTTLGSLRWAIEGYPHRVIIVDDQSPEIRSNGNDPQPYCSKIYSLVKGWENVVAIVQLTQRKGVSFAWNLGFNLTQVLNFWDCGAEWVLYLQDDMESLEKAWPVKLIDVFEKVESAGVPVGFVTGFHSLYHPIEKVMKVGDWDVLIKPSSTGGCLMARRRFWEEIAYVPRLNPDGTERGFPHQGRGSGIDVWWTGCVSEGKFCRRGAGPRSLFSQGKKVVCVPGFLNHLGENVENSTWRKEKK